MKPIEDGVAVKELKSSYHNIGIYSKGEGFLAIRTLFEVRNSNPEYTATSQLPLCYDICLQVHVLKCQEAQVSSVLMVSLTYTDFKMGNSNRESQEYSRNIEGI